MKKLLLILVLFTSCKQDLNDYKGCTVFSVTKHDYFAEPSYCIMFLENKKHNLFSIKVDIEYFEIYGYKDTIK